EKKQREEEERQAKREAARARKKGEVGRKEAEDARAIEECEEQAWEDGEANERVKYEAALIVRIATRFGSSGAWTKIAEARARGADIPLDARKVYLLAHPDKCPLAEAADATAILNAQRPPEMSESRAGGSGAGGVGTKEAVAARVAARRAGGGAAAGGSGDALATRVDPEDGQELSFQELVAKYKGTYSQEELVEYWGIECTPVEAPSARQSAAAAFEAHLAALTEALDVQAALVRSALDLQPASSLVGFKTVAEVAIGKFSVAIGDLRSELIVAATVAASSELPEAAAVEAPASKAQPSPGIVAASLAGCVAGMCRERAPQHRSPSGAGLDPKPAPSRRSGRGSHGAADAEAGPASTQAPRRHRSRRPGTGTGQGVVPMQPTPSGEEACADSEGIGSWGSRRSSGGNGQGGVLLHPMPSGEEVRFEGKSIGSGGSCHSGGNGQGGARMQSITSGEEVHFEGKSIGSEVSDLADGHLTMPNERANTARQSCAESAIFLSRSRSGVSQTSPCISGVLNPDWPLRLAWDLAVIFMVICDSVVIPFQLAEFRVEPEFDQFWLWFTVSLFSCDLVMSFFTGYKAGKKDVSLQEGTLVTDKVSIAMHYLSTVAALRGWFWIDFLSTVPWSVIAKAATSGSEGGSSSAGEVTKLAKVVKLTRLLRLMRMLRLAKLSVIWDRIEGRIGSITALNVVSMLKVLGTWAAICHWGACIWWMVGKRDSLVMLVTMQDAKVGGLHWTEVPRMHSAFDESWTWVERPASEQYVFCFYWILGVMRTMPAEVTPVTLTERVFVLLFMFFAVAAFAVNVTRITQAWFRFGSRRDAFKEEMACFRMHLRTINCGDALQMRTQACLNHLFEKRKIHAKELGLLNALPEGLKSKLSQAHRIHYLRMIPRLHNWIDPALRHVCDATEVLDFLPGDKLTEK
ncbi:unnamed protein product, partial [Prorocentrum cordatum]